MTLDAALLLGGIACLYFGAEWLVKGAARLASGLGVSPIVVGLTVVSLGTSAPELVVSVFASLHGSGDLAVGNVLGSNLANVGLILGLSALVRPLTLASRVIRREVPVMLGVTALLYPLMLDHSLGRGDGVLLLCVMAAYLLFMGWTAGEESAEVEGEFEEYVEEEAYLVTRHAARDLGLLVVGAAGVVLGGQLIVTGALDLARMAGVPEMAIGLSVVAVGTSLPELATSVMAAYRGESDIAVGNVIGSNVFNVAAVLGAASTVRPIAVAPSVLTVELPAVLVVSALMVPISLTGLSVRRREGALLLAAYAAAGFWVFLR